MSDAIIDIANAVLYQGYNFHPYRPGAFNNGQRRIFCGVYPRAFTSHSGSDLYAMQAECLLRSKPDAVVNIRLRFLQLMLCSVLSGEKVEVPAETLEVAGQQHSPWEAAMEREIELTPVTLASLAENPLTVVFYFAPKTRREELRDDKGSLVGTIIQDARALAVSIVMSARELAPRIWQPHVRVENTTAINQDECLSRELAQLHAFASAHLILRVEGGEFVSLAHPPEDLLVQAQACVQEGCWPVLAGLKGSHDALLASPIVLQDYPQIASESEGTCSAVARSEIVSH